MKYKKTLIVLVSIITILPILAFADQINYVPLEPGAIEGLNTNSTNLVDFLNGVFKFGIAIAVVLAFIMIVYGGIMKMTTDSWTKQDTAKEKITNAIYGLGLALVSWLILYTINPCLVTWTGNGCDNTFLNPQTQTQESSGGGR